MRLSNIPNDGPQILKNHMSEVIILIYLDQLQRAHIQIIVIQARTFHQYFALGFESGVVIADVHAGNPVNIYFQVKHKPPEVTVGGKLTKQPVVNPAAF